MEKYNSWKRTEDIEIDLPYLVYRLCLQWKQMLICALAFAVILGGYGYFRNREIAVVETDAPEDKELTEEKQSIMAAAELERETRRLEEYLDNSILMQIDPYHKDKIVMSYSIEQAQRKDLQKITESYLSFIMNGGAADTLKKSGSSDWRIDKSYLAELINAYQKTYSTPYEIVMDGSEEDGMLAETLFCVEITGEDQKMAKQLALDIQSALKGYYPTVQDMAGNHKLILFDKEESIVADSNLQTQQHEKKALLAANLSNIKGMTDAFSEGQMAAYKSAIGMEDGQEEQKEDIAIGHSGISKKYIILGFIGGAFVYCGIFVCWYLFRDTVKSAEEMKERYTFPFYGSIPLKADADKNGRKPSGMQQETYEQGKAQMLSRIRLACKKQGITRLCAASDFSFHAQEKEYLERIAKQLEAWGIDMVIGENANKDTAMWDTLAEIGNVLMVCRIGTTTHRMIDETMSFYVENDIAVAGAMAFIQGKC